MVKEPSGTVFLSLFALWFLLFKTFETELFLWFHSGHCVNDFKLEFLLIEMASIQFRFLFQKAFSHYSKNNGSLIHALSSKTLKFLFESLYVSARSFFLLQTFVCLPTILFTCLCSTLTWQVHPHGYEPLRPFFAPLLRCKSHHRPGNMRFQFLLAYFLMRSQNVWQSHWYFVQITTHQKACSDWQARKLPHTLDSFSLPSSHSLPWKNLPFLLWPQPSDVRHV